MGVIEAKRRRCGGDDGVGDVAQRGGEGTGDGVRHSGRLLGYMGKLGWRAKQIRAKRGFVERAGGAVTRKHGWLEENQPTVFRP